MSQGPIRVGAPPEAYLEWLDTSPVALSTVAQELGRIPANPEVEEAAKELALLGAEQAERSGTPLFFRTEEQTASVRKGDGPILQSQEILAAGMLRPSHLVT
jgi:type I restriction enzyme R subunit